MGTNYYVKETNQHIGKSSYGWSFVFHGYPHQGLVSWKSWKQFLKDKMIVDEYDHQHNYDDFVMMIETYKSPGWTNPDTGLVNMIHTNNTYDWTDLSGYHFIPTEFS